MWVFRYYQEYCKLYYANIILGIKLQQLLDQKKDLNSKLAKLEVLPSP